MSISKRKIREALLPDLFFNLAVSAEGVMVESTLPRLNDTCTVMHVRRRQSLSHEHLLNIRGVGEVHHGGVLQVELDDVADLEVTALID